MTVVDRMVLAGIYTRTAEYCETCPVLGGQRRASAQLDGHARACAPEGVTGSSGFPPQVTGTDMLLHRDTKPATQLLCYPLVADVIDKKEEENYMVIL